MKVDVGESEPRQILARIAEAYQPEQLKGRTIVIVANLKAAMKKTNAIRPEIQCRFFAEEPCPSPGAVMAASMIVPAMISGITLR